MKSQKNKKLSTLWNNNLYSFLAAIIAMIIMLFVYMCYRFFPIGDNIVLRMDLYHQYAPLFAELYDRIFQGKTLLYSFTSGLGSGFLGNYFNYLSSPTMLFVLIFGHKNVPEAVAAMVMTKAAVSSFSFSYFLKRTSGKYDLTTTAFGILYAFSGWFVAYYWNIMWLDAMCVFPLVMLGIYLIIKENKSLLYTVSLAFVMITNYYMGYMVCILSVIMFLFFYFSKYTLSDKINPDYILKKKYTHSILPKFYNNRLLKSGLTFAVSSVFAACIAAFSLIPVYFVLKHSSATSSSFPTDFNSYFSVFDFLANHFAGLETTIRSSGNDVLPNIYCGVLTLVLIPPFFFSKHFSVREKLATVVTVAVFYFSFNINYLNYIWHGFHFPNDLPYRFSFAYSFFLLIIAYKTVSQIEKIRLKTVLASSCAVCGFVVLVEELGSKNVSSLSLWTTIAFAIIYAVVISFMKDKKYIRSYIAVLLLCSVCTEILVADTSNYVVTQNKEDYVEGYDEVQEAKKVIASVEKDPFSRTELSSLVRRMDNCWYGYNGASTFTSMAYEELAHLQLKLGLSGNAINSYTYHCQTAVYNTLFGIDYIIDNSDYTKTDNYKPNFGDNLYKKITDDTAAMPVYDYKYDLPLAFSVKNGADENWDFEDSNPFKVQSELWKAVTGIDNVFDEINVSVKSTSNLSSLTDKDISNKTFTMKKNSSSDSSELMLELLAEKDETVYLYASCADEITAYITVNGTMFSVDISEPFIVDCGSLKKDDSVFITLGLGEDKSSSNITLYAVALNEENFKKGYDKITSDGVIKLNDNFKENKFSGTITVPGGDMIFTSIPSDDSWEITIDGEKADKDSIVRIGNSLIGLKVKAGQHTLGFKYVPSGLIIGSAITVAAIIVLVVLLVLKKKKIGIFSKNFRKDSLELGKWRDFSAEEDARNAAAAKMDKEADRDLLAFYAAREDIISENDNSWASMLDGAESIAQMQEELRQKFEELKAIEDARLGNTPSVAENIQTQPAEPTVIKEKVIETRVDLSKKFKTVVSVIIAVLSALVICLLLFVISLSAGKGNSEPKTDYSPASMSQTDETETKKQTETTDKKTETTTKAPETTTKAPETTTKTPETTTKKPETTTKKPETTTKAPETTTKKPVTTTGSQPQYDTYVVQAGDYAFAILRKAGLDPNAYLEEFYAINNGKTVFNPGDKVFIPNGD